MALVGKVLDTNPQPVAARPAAPAPAAGVTVYLPDGDRVMLEEHAAPLNLPLAALLRRHAVTAVRVTRRSGVTPGQLVNGVAAALGRDFPATFGASAPRSRAARIAEAAVRWLLARFAVLPLPAATGPDGLVWRVAVDADGDGVTVRATTTRVLLALDGHTFELSPSDAAAVASALAAASGPAGGEVPAA